MPTKTSRILVRVRADIVAIFVALLASDWGLGASQSAAPPSYLDSLITLAQKRTLAQEPGWRKLLLIPERWYPSDHSLIDDQGFFLASTGNRDPEVEMTATLRAFFEPLPSNPASAEAHAQCRFPARLAWLDAQLGLDTAKMPKPPCETLRKFVDFLGYEKVSLVFSAYYANNPASMFGHSFLRLHRPRDGRSDVALLDDIVNFSAFVADPGSWLYPLKGLAGSYRGQFSLLPYYRKIQEYTNAESRDLWEYELNLTQAQVRMLELVLWELGGTHLDYYYLDDNCSYVMLALLEAIDPSLRLTRHFTVYAVPADTLRTVTKQNAMVRSVTYRPSTHSLFVARYSALTPPEQELVCRLVGDAPPAVEDAFPKCDVTCQARVMDATLEYIDFQEKLAGSRVPVRYGKLRSALLSRRAKAGVVVTQASVVPPRNARPELGHDATQWGLSGGQEKTQSFMDFHWRPALHGLADADEGYSGQLQIAFLDAHVRWRPEAKRVTVEDLELFEIMSIPEDVPLLPAHAWRFHLGYEAKATYGGPDEENRYHSQFGFGKVYHAKDGSMAMYGLLHADLGYFPVGKSHWFLGPTLMLGLKVKLTPTWRLAYQVQMGQHYATAARKTSLRHDLVISRSWSRSLDFRLTGMLRQGSPELALGFAYFP